MRTRSTLLVVALAVAILAGCAGGQMGGGIASSGPAVDAPKFSVGSRWVYRGKDGYRQSINWEETHVVTAIGADGITVRVTATGAMAAERTEILASPGVVRVGAVSEFESDRFDPALIRYQFPLTQGQSWSQTMRNANKPPNPFGAIQRRVVVDGYESVTTPAGTFNAVRMRIIMQLDDGTVWRFPTECNYVVWYAPEVGAMVKETQRSYYVEKEGLSGAAVPGQNATIELVSYTAGR